MLKDILVLSDGTPADETRFAFAAALAADFEANFNVVFINELPSTPVVAGGFGVGGFVPPVENATHDEAMKHGAATQDALVARFARQGQPVTVFRVDQVAGSLSDATAAIARTHDLFVMTLPAHQHSGSIASGIFAEVLHGGAHGIIGLPETGTPGHRYEHVTIGWNGSREAARAVREAMPFLQRAREVVVLLVDQPLRKAGETRRPGDELVTHLAHHGVKATLSRVASDELRTSDAILAEVTRMKSELLVMGAHAEGGIMRWFRSDVARDVVAAANIPVLMAH